MVGNIVYTPRRSLTEADVVDNLLSTATNLPLSAAQGNELEKTKVGQDELSNYLRLSGGNRELNGAITFKHSAFNDVYTIKGGKFRGFGSDDKILKILARNNPDDPNDSTESSWIDIFSTHGLSNMVTINKSSASGEFGTDVGTAILLHSKNIETYALTRKNSNAIIKGGTAPTDTSVIWVDTSTKSIKCYINGTWQKLSY